MPTGFRLPVAIPVHNEEGVLAELSPRLRIVPDSLPGGPHEMLFVDDMSTDRTFEMLAKAAREDSRIVALSLSRNFGHQAAITAARDHVTGDAAVVTGRTFVKSGMNEPADLALKKESPR